MKTLNLLVIALLISSLMLSAQKPQKAYQLKAVEGERQVDKVKSALAIAKVDPTQYEFSGQVTAAVYLDGRNYESEDYCLLSVVGSQVRGVSRGMWFEPGKVWVHNHLTYSNMSDGDTIHFRLQDTRSGKWYSFSEYVIFKPDMLVNNALDPFILKNSSLLEPSALSLEPSLSVWPNPVSHMATIKYVITNDQPVVIQVIDNSGRIAGEIDHGKQTAGEHQLEWDIRTLQNGAYFLRIKNVQNASKRVVISR